jgi:hypothetical protein
MPQRVHRQHIGVGSHATRREVSPLSLLTHMKTQAHHSSIKCKPSVQIPEGKKLLTTMMKAILRFIR